MKKLIFTIFLFSILLQSNAKGIEGVKIQGIVKNSNEEYAVLSYELDLPVKLTSSRRFILVLRHIWGRLKPYKYIAQIIDNQINKIVFSW
jgi:hypothetical protein